MPRLHLTLAVALVLTAAACGRGEEQRQVDAFTLSIRKAQEASVNGSFALSPEEVQQASNALREALAASEAVTDPVLAELHPELPDRYRTLFVPAIKMRLSSLDAMASNEPTTAEQLQWQVPMQEWGRWYDEALPTLRRNIDR